LDAGCFLFTAEGFSCSLYVLYGGLRISFDQKEILKNFQLYFYQLLVIKTLDPDSLEMMDPDPDSMNPDPQNWFCDNKM
jgi:hypothetical protein